MKKAGIFLLSVAMICLMGCNSSQRVSIDAYYWRMTTVQGPEGENGAIIACPAAQADIYEGAEILELTCEAKDGSLTLTDLTNNESYTGTYRAMQKSPRDILYEITMADETGHAVTALTTYFDGGESPTLIISLGGYDINFTGTASEA